MPPYEAIKKPEKNLDLVEISPTALSVRITDYGKYLYQQERREN